VYLRLVTLSEPVVLRSKTALTVILVGFNNGRAGGWPCSRTRGGGYGA